jgi:nucleotide-binding universal stress UspA family protein
VSAADGDTAAQQTADALATKLGASIVDLGGAEIDLIVVGSQPSSSSRRITLSGSSRTLLNTLRGSVLVVPSGDPLGL